MENHKVFNSEGEFLLKFGSNGEGNGQFNAPTGVAVDVNGNIIVADWGNSRIQVRGGRRSNAQILFILFRLPNSMKWMGWIGQNTLYCTVLN